MHRNMEVNFILKTPQNAWSLTATFGIWDAQRESPAFLNQVLLLDPGAVVLVFSKWKHEQKQLTFIAAVN